jgi:hypothetical protein
MKYVILSEGPNGPGDGVTIEVSAASLTGAKRIATRWANGSRCHLYISDIDGPLAERHAVDDYEGCYRLGWGPWIDCRT